MQSLLLAGNTLKLAVLFDNPLETRTGAQQGGAFGAFAPTPEIFKTLHSNFDICRNFQRIKMKFYILINFKKSYWNFSLPCPLSVSLHKVYLETQAI